MNSWNETIRLKIALLNAENLFLLFDQPVTGDLNQLAEIDWQKLSGSVYQNKSLKKSHALAHVIKEINADIIMFCEVGGHESIKNFNELFLNSEYSCALIEGNSNRHIDVGFLIRKTADYYFDLMSNKNRAINFLYPHERNPALHLPSHKFSRDVAELKLFKKNKDQPFLIFLLTHLKSRLDHDGIDPQGFERRQAELNTLLDIYNETKQKYPKTPIIVGGDFNGNASRNQTDVEFQKIYSSTDLDDVLELAKVPQDIRASYYQIKNNRTEGKQIDYCFISELLMSALKPNSAHIYRYKDHMGLEIDRPQTIDAKLNLPSDHYPLVFELENLKIW